MEPFQVLWRSIQIQKPCHREVDRPLNESVALPRGRTALEPDTDYYKGIQSLLQPSGWGESWIVDLNLRLPPQIVDGTLFPFNSH